MKRMDIVLIALIIIMIASSVSGYLIILKSTELQYTHITGRATGTATITLTVVDPPITIFDINITLYNGTNRISIPLQLNDSNVSLVLSQFGSGSGINNEGACTGNASDDFNGTYSAVWTYVYNASREGNWLLYDPGKLCFAMGIQDFFEFSVNSTYVILMNSSGNLSITGSAIPNTTIQLFNGSNLPGYPTMTERPVNESLIQFGTGSGINNEAACTGNASDDFNGTYSAVWTYVYNASMEPNWELYDPGKLCFAMGIQDFHNFTPTQGYQIMFNATVGNWTINW